MRRQGRVKFYDVRRGYGFIVPDDGGADIFVHHTAVGRAGLPVLVAGMRLGFDLMASTPGRPPQACRLLLLADDAPPAAEEADVAEAKSGREAAE